MVSDIVSESQMSYVPVGKDELPSGKAYSYVSAAFYRTDHMLLEIEL